MGIWFPADYLRRADAFEMLRLFTPNVWHPNVSRDLPLICIGRLTPGTTLVDSPPALRHSTFQKYNPREDDSLNKQHAPGRVKTTAAFPFTAGLSSAGL